MLIKTNDALYYNYNKYCKNVKKNWELNCFIIQSVENWWGTKEETADVEEYRS